MTDKGSFPAHPDIAPLPVTVRSDEGDWGAVWSWLTGRTPDPKPNEGVVRDGHYNEEDPRLS